MKAQVLLTSVLNKTSFNPHIVTEIIEFETGAEASDFCKRINNTSLSTWYNGSFTVYREAILL